MRIISQDGTIDIPYENFVFGITKDNFIVAIRDTVARPSEVCQGIVAEYSSKEKAQKAMEMLREQYSRLQVVKILASGTCEHMEKSLSKDEFLECNLKYREMNIFQFPQDEDVEV